MRAAAVVLSVLALTTTAIAAETADADRAALIIESGRLGVMMDQSRELLPQLVPPPIAVQPDPALQDRAAIYDNLVSAVFAYNAAAHRACRDGLVGRALCPGPYLPGWLGQPRAYSDAELRAMTDDAGGRLMPFWTALCNAAPPAKPGEFVCPME